MLDSEIPLMRVECVPVAESFLYWKSNGGSEGWVCMEVSEEKQASHSNVWTPVLEQVQDRPFVPFFPLLPFSLSVSSCFTFPISDHLSVLCSSVLAVFFFYTYCLFIHCREITVLYS